MLATYAVLSQHMFVAADVAGRAVRWSLIAGIGIVVYVGALVLLETAASEVLAIDFPLVTTLAVIVTLALFDPIAERVRQLTASTPREVDHARLLVALGKDAMLAQDPEQAVEPALARMVRTFELVGAELVDRDGKLRARVGSLDATDPLAVRLELADGAERQGAAVFGRKRNGLSFTPPERDALTLAASYLGSSLRLAERHHEQASALAELRAERADVQSRGSALSNALAGASSPQQGTPRLRARLPASRAQRRPGPALGRREGRLAPGGGDLRLPLRPRRPGRIQGRDPGARLAGRRPRPRGRRLPPDHAWVSDRSSSPDGEPADRPDRSPFHNDRYRLDPSVVAWSDIGEFDRLLADAARGEPSEALRALEQARALYRGDFLDDCPFYGDSAQVEDRRTDVRRRYVDVLIELGGALRERGDRTAAANSYRQAQAVAQDDLPQIAEALGQLASARPAGLG